MKYRESIVITKYIAIVGIDVIQFNILFKNPFNQVDALSNISFAELLKIPY